MASMQPSFAFTSAPDGLARGVIASLCTQVSAASFSVSRQNASGPRGSAMCVAASDMAAQRLQTTRPAGR